MNLLFAASLLISADAFKIGYVDMQSALMQSEEGKRELAKMKKDFDTKQQKLNVMQDELKKLKEAYDKQASMMTEEAKQKKQAELQAKFVDMQQTYANLQKELAEKQQTVTQGIFTRFRGLIEKIGDRDGYALVLDRSADHVLFYKRHMDITDEVVRTYNQQHP